MVASDADPWSSLLANASVIALLVVLGMLARQGSAADQRRLGNVLLGAAALVVAVAIVAFVWTLTRPN